MFCLVSKCKALKAKIKVWNQPNLGTYFDKLIRIVDYELQTIQQQILTNVNLPRLQTRQKLLLKKRLKLLSYSEEYWK